MQANDVVYAPVSHWEKHTLDLYYPSYPKDTPASLIVFVHGGAWRTGDKSNFTDLAKNLAHATRNVVGVINYTLSIANIKDDPTSVPPEAQYPKHVHDVAKALGYLYTHAHQHGGYDRDQIYLVGHSAGGQITGLLVLRPDIFLEPIEAELGLPKGTLHKAIQGVVGVEGIYDADRLLKTWPTYRDFVIQAFGQDSVTLIEGSPFGQRVPVDSTFRLPKYAVIQSNQDELVDPAQTTEYYAYLQSLLGSSETKDQVTIEFGDWGLHDDMLQTAQFTKTIAKYIHGWESQLTSIQ
ncbi:Kynurenine formamidase [Mortierella sp. GBA30]|nr:Kynurenine formamidase [Mortierella sp. GBA30]